MNFDDYWDNLVNRVYQEGEQLQGVEDEFYRIATIYGETMVGGIQSYFFERSNEYKKDMLVLNKHGFEETIEKFEEARIIIFNELEFTLENSDLIEDRKNEITSNEDLADNIDEKLREIYTGLIELLKQLNDFKFQYGLENGLFTEDNNNKQF